MKRHRRRWMGRCFLFVLTGAFGPRKARNLAKNTKATTADDSPPGRRVLAQGPPGHKVPRLRNCARSIGLGTHTTRSRRTTVRRAAGCSLSQALAQGGQQSARSQALAQGRSAWPASKRLRLTAAGAARGAGRSPPSAAVPLARPLPGPLEARLLPRDHRLPQRGVGWGLPGWELRAWRFP